MDWGVAFVGLVVLVFVRDSLWKPYLSGYATKKGERLATHEDIENVLDEVRKVTTETEKIKAEISSDLWKQQWKLDRKREAYADLIAAGHQVIADLMNLEEASKHIDTNQEAIDRFNSLLKALFEHRNDMVLAIATTSIFSEHKDATSILDGFARSTSSDKSYGQASDVLVAQVSKVIKAAREEFGMADVPDA